MYFKVNTIYEWLFNFMANKIKGTAVKGGEKEKAYGFLFLVD
jgi:hypothetical protein